MDGDGVISGPDLREVIQLLTKQHESQDDKLDHPLSDEYIDNFIKNASDPVKMTAIAGVTDLGNLSFSQAPVTQLKIRHP